MASCGDLFDLIVFAVLFVVEEVPHEYGVVVRRGYYLELVELKAEHSAGVFLLMLIDLI